MQFLYLLDSVYSKVNRLNLLFSVINIKHPVLVEKVHYLEKNLKGRMDNFNLDNCCM